MAQNYEVTMKLGDAGEPVRSHVVNDSNRQAPAWGAASARFVVLSVDEDTGIMSEVLNAAAVIEAPQSSSGVLRYDWGASDTTTLGLGRFRCLFKVTGGPASPESFPDEGYIWLTIEPGAA